MICQPIKREMIVVKTFKNTMVMIGLSALVSNSALAVTPVLDGYAYQLNSNISIDLKNQIISFDSDMLNCQQPNGDPPLDTVNFAANTNGQFIGVTQFYYIIAHGNFYFTSETVDLLCDNG